MKAWFKQTWLRFKKWTIGILIAIGLVSVPMIGMGGTKDFTWQNPTQYTDGSVFTPADQRETRIYCERNGAAIAVIVVTGSLEAFTANLETGTYSCYATTVSIEGAESFASNTVNFTVDPRIPNAPVLTQ